MTKKELAAIKHGDKILHKHYGECLVQEIKYAFGGEFFGIIVQPLTDEGKFLLHCHSGASIGMPLLEDSLNQVRLIDRPFKEENKNLVHFRKLFQEAAAKKEQDHAT